MAVCRHSCCRRKIGIIMNLILPTLYSNKLRYKEAFFPDISWLMEKKRRMTIVPFSKIGKRVSIQIDFKVNKRRNSTFSLLGNKRIHFMDNSIWRSHVCLKKFLFGLYPYFL